MTHCQKENKKPIKVCDGYLCILDPARTLLLFLMSASSLSITPKLGDTVSSYVRKKMIGTREVLNPLPLPASFWEANGINANTVSAQAFYFLCPQPEGSVLPKFFSYNACL